MNATLTPPTETAKECKSRMQRERRAAKKVQQTPEIESPAEPTPTPVAPIPAIEVGGIRTRAILAHLHIAVWEGKKKDKCVEQEVTDGKGAEAGTGAWWTRLLPSKAFTPIRACGIRARRYHDKNSLPWNDNGVRLLPAVSYLEYMSEMRKFRQEFQTAVDEFVAKYDEIIREAPQRLGKLLEGVKYPTADQVRNKFRLYVEIEPMPSSSDFRVALGDEQVQELRNEFESHANDKMASAMRDVWSRLYTQVKDLADRLGSEDAIIQKRTITNLISLCDLLPRLNITEDENLERMRQEVLVNLSIDAEVVRENKPARATAAAKAQGIVDAMSDYFHPTTEEE